MNVVYYIETNLICIIILSLFGNPSLKKVKQQSSVSIVFNYIVYATILFCISDMIAGVFRGALFSGARSIIEISNWIYFEMLSIISYLWAVYVTLSVDGSNAFAGKRKYWLIAPLIAYTIVALTNSFTGILFIIDAKNLYVRSDGIFLHWIVTWGYFLFATYKTAKAYVKETSKSRKRNMKPLIYFFIAPLIASIVQMLFYGVTSNQVGVTISIVMIYITLQNANVLTDPLTGLNNRRGLDNYFERYLDGRSGLPIMLRMIDINSFKQINDKFGHMAGDAVLIEIANALKVVCQKTTNSVFLCRYGGDEFLIAEIIRDEEDLSLLDSRICEAVEALDKKFPYPISVCIGSASGICNSAEGLKELLNKADENMYSQKRLHKALKDSSDCKTN